MASFLPSVVVVRDGERDALRNPPPRAFEPFRDLVYFHVSDAELPPATHYFFNCSHANARVYQLADDARRAGASLTFIARSVDPALARYVDQTGASLMPAYGFAHQISERTLFSAAQRVLSGERVVARSFMNQSIGSTTSNADHRNVFVRLLTEASRLANDSIRVVAAVLSLHRTGSNYLRDLVGLTASGRVNVFHEHKVPPASDVIPCRNTPIFDQAFLEPDPARARALRRAHLRDMIVAADRRFIFVAERAPDDRLKSFFQEQHMAWLCASYDPERHRLRDATEIQRSFEAWLEPQLRLQRKWYRTRLVDGFGLDVLAAEPTEDGFLLGQSGVNALLVVRTQQLSALRENLVGASASREAYASVSRNSVARAGIGYEIDRAFRRQIRFPEAVSDALWQIPEVAYLHPTDQERSATL